ncbi:MAG: DUF4238 domain-containing protein [Enterococcus durans]
MKKDYVKKQHYIPQFALKSFQNKQKRIAYTNIEKNPLEIYYSRTENLMQEKDFYEIKSSNNYVHRNSLEDDYSFFENYMSPDFKRFLELTKRPNFQCEFIKIIKNNEWAQIEAVLLFYLGTLLIRGKNVKKFFHSNSKISTDYNYIMYLLATTSKSYTAEFAKEMFMGQELEVILQFIREEDNNPVSRLMEHLMENYQIRIYMTKGNKKLFLSDNPVIVQKLKDQDYILPLSPSVCMILVPIKLKQGIISVDSKIYSLSDEDVDKLNEYSVLNSHRLVIISNEENLKFVEETRVSEEIKDS